MSKKIEFKNPYWSEKMKLEYLQRYILVHSYLYYVLDNSVISDKQYDVVSMQLVDMMSNMSKEDIEKSKYNYVMYDFDGSTGFDLFYRLNEHDKSHIIKISNTVLSTKI